MNVNISGRLSVLAILELIVGAIVLLGAAALVYFSIDATGKALGAVHATLGIVGLSAGILLWMKNNQAKVVTLWSNLLIIGFSIGSEAVLSVTGSLPNDRYADSILGTLAAVVMGMVVMFLLTGPVRLL